MKIIKRILTAVGPWTFGLASIASTLYFTNGGVDFTVTELMGSELGRCGAGSVDTKRAISRLILAFPVQ